MKLAIASVKFLGKTDLKIEIITIEDNSCTSTLSIIKKSYGKLNYISNGTSFVKQ
jgi:hypothetical protein